MSNLPLLLPGRWYALPALLMLTACGGGSGGDGSNGGQAPDPVVVDIPVAYIQRPIPVDEAGEPVYPDVFMPDSFTPGGELYLKARATTQAEVVNITRAAFAEHEFFDAENPNYDVKDVAVDSAGTRLLFAMRAPLDPDLDEDDEDQPTWNIWEYHLATKVLRRVISSEFEAEKGHDVSPRYLPDGRIIFSSNRQKRSKEILLDEGKPQFGAVTTQDNDITSFLLHSMKDDGTAIEQLTYNQSHDLQPHLLANGRVLFMRWKGQQLSFYTMNPDGTDVQPYFGAQSLNRETDPDEQENAPRLLRPQVLEDGRIAAIYLHNRLQLGGDMVAVNGALAMEGELQSLSGKPVDITLDLVSLSGRFASLAPVYDGTNRLLVSWSQCRLLETATNRLRPCLPTLFDDGLPEAGYEEAPPFYGLWIHDLNNQTQLPVVLAEDGKVFTEALALEQGAYNPAYLRPETDQDLAALGLGVLHIRSVYDRDGIFNAMNSGVATLNDMIARNPDQRPARFIRLVKAVARVDNDTLDDQPDNVYGNLMNANNGIQEIIGYAPVEADGSVMVTVPADVAFSLEILDRDGRQISANHTTYLQLRPGEKMTCNGCHDPRNTAVIHGRYDLPESPASINPGALSAINFPNTQRYERLGVPIAPRMGETMAEFAARSTYCEETMNGQVCAAMAGPAQDQNLRNPSVDLLFRDVWAAPGLAPADGFSYRYDDLVPGLSADQITAPTPAACREESSWNANCRVVINYEYHIQPLWEREREAITIGLFSANNCLGCHSSSVELDGTTQTRIPAGQLNLARTKQQVNAVMVSYEELTASDNTEILNEETGLPEDQLVPTDECNEDIDGNPIVDENGVCTDPVLEPIPIPASMSRGGARASRIFFDTFATGSHAGYLNDAELKLLSEWLDTGGRYYTNPFELAIPAN